MSMSSVSDRLCLSTIAGLPKMFYVCSDTIIIIITFFREIVVVLLIHSRQVVEYSEISKETSELREGGR